MRLFVGGMDFKTTQDDIIRHFTVVAGSDDSATIGGPVAVLGVEIIMDRDTGRSKGFGFVELDTNLGLDRLVGFFGQFKLGGKKLTLGEAHAKRPRGSSGERRDNERTGERDGNRSRYVTERGR